MKSFLENKASFSDEEKKCEDSLSGQRESMRENEEERER